MAHGTLRQAKAWQAIAEEHTGEPHVVVKHTGKTLLRYEAMSRKMAESPLVKAYQWWVIVA